MTRFDSAWKILPAFGKPLDNYANGEAAFIGRE
jgi:hypothetical protein